MKNILKTLIIFISSFQLAYAGSVANSENLAEEFIQTISLPTFDSFQRVDAEGNEIGALEQNADEEGNIYFRYQVTDKHEPLGFVFRVGDTLKNERSFAFAYQITDADFEHVFYRSASTLDLSDAEVMNMELESMLNKLTSIMRSEIRDHFNDLERGKIENVLALIGVFVSIGLVIAVASMVLKPSGLAPYHLGSILFDSVRNAGLVIAAIACFFAIWKITELINLERSQNAAREEF